MTTYTVAVISAGLSEPSSTRLLADRLAQAVRRDGARSGLRIDVVDLPLRSLARQIADMLVTGFPPPALKSALDAVHSADALIAVTPVFSASYSGLFKSFFDVADPQGFVGKPVLLAATGGSARHSLVLDYAMRPLFAYLKADVLPTAVFAATADFGSDAGGRSLDERIDLAGRQLVAALDRPDRSSSDAPTDLRAGRSAPTPLDARRRRDADPFDNRVPFDQQLAHRFG
jgi:FMN reductase